jgi:hypothetical protein
LILLLKSDLNYTIQSTSIKLICSTQGSINNVVYTVNLLIRMNNTWTTCIITQTFRRQATVTLQRQSLQRYYCPFSLPGVRCNFTKNLLYMQTNYLQDISISISRIYLHISQHIPTGCACLACPLSSSGTPASGRSAADCAGGTTAASERAVWSVSGGSVLDSRCWCY